MPNTSRPDQAERLARLEAKRKKLGVSLETLAERSGVPPRTLARIRRDKRGYERHIRNLNFALRSIEREIPAHLAAFGGGETDLDGAARVAFNGFLAAVAVRFAPEQHRKIALYLLVTIANVPPATAGRVYGCSKQYVSKALGQVEDLREDPAIAAQLQELEQSLAPET